MADLPQTFQQALYRTIILLASALALAFCWAYLHLPEGNLMIAVLAALTAVRISGLVTCNTRLRELIAIIGGSAILQYIVSITYDLQLFNLLLPVAAGYFFLRVMSGSSAYIVLLAGFLAYTAPPPRLQYSQYSQYSPPPQQLNFL